MDDARMAAGSVPEGDLQPEDARPWNGTSDEDGSWTEVTDPDERPDPPEDIVKAARLAPDMYFYIPDPSWSGEGVPPDWAVIGRWRSGPDGEVLGWQENDAYVPSPEALGWGEPHDPVDRAAQYAVTGYGKVTELMELLEEGVFWVPLDEEGRAVREKGDDGRPLIPFLTAPRPPKEELPSVRMALPDLMQTLEDNEGLMYISGTAPITVAIGPEALVGYRNSATDTALELSSHDEGDDTEKPGEGWEDVPAEGPYLSASRSILP